MSGQVGCTVLLRRTINSLLPNSLQCLVFLDQLSTLLSGIFLVHHCLSTNQDRCATSATTLDVRSHGFKSERADDLLRSLSPFPRASS